MNWLYGLFRCDVGPQLSEHPSSDPVSRRSGLSPGREFGGARVADGSCASQKQN